MYASGFTYPPGVRGAHALRRTPVAWLSGKRQVLYLGRHARCYKSAQPTAHASSRETLAEQCLPNALAQRTVASSRETRPRHCPPQDRTGSPTKSAGLTVATFK
ncbi:hypothetical protein [Brasilonema bromeliae]|uniref:hypothetical protein n=1 Tax=Brasilonema bromeliae TaxID=383615 RepID=UPI00145CD3F1|nr:hypothetical protein [Brasilonema bromeliae]